MFRKLSASFRVVPRWCHLNEPCSDLLGDDNLRLNVSGRVTLQLSSACVEQTMTSLCNPNVCPQLTDLAGGLGPQVN